MLKAGTETGSLVNHVMSRRRMQVPQVGDGATLMSWTDRTAATVVAVRETAKQVFVTIQADHARRVDTNGMSDSQVYEFTPNPDALKVTYRFAKQADGSLKGIGEAKRVMLGYRSEYYDFSF